MRLITRVLTATLAALLVPLAAAAGPHMALPKDFPANMTVLPGKRVFNMLGKKPLAIPPYQATEFRQGPVTFPQFDVVTVGAGNIAISRTASQTKQGYRFKLEENGHPAWDAQCRLERSSSATRVEGKTSSVEKMGEIVQALQCELRDQAGGDPWLLVLRADIHPRLFTVDADSDGALVRGETTIKVTATYAIEGWSVSSPQPSGFLFARGGNWVAAAEWTPPGSLRLDPTLEPGERGPIAAASAALLLYATLSTPALAMH
ncbi:MAG TPA: hypothetical protein VHR45_25030 [Thermoanaerobaculia bacterium]|nr:hypothetical protein [Thermoanaerobaculia bacterium]